MLRFLLLSFCTSLCLLMNAQDEVANSPWHIPAKGIDQNLYYGVTLANGMVGLVSSPNPMQVQDVVLNGVYDYYQRGRVSNILKTFNHMNLELIVDGTMVNTENISDFQQVLNMQEAELVTTFTVPGKARVTHRLLALRHLPYSALSRVEIEALTDIEFEARSIIESPNHLQDVRNYFADIVRPHVNIPLLTSTGLSPSGKYKVAASTSFLFQEEHEDQPEVTHIDWDYNRHWAYITHAVNAGSTYEFAVVGTSISSKQAADPHNEAERMTIYASLEGEERLLQFHWAAWADLWQSDIIIEGDLRSQRAVRSALYHLYSFSRAGTAYSLSPMGLSGLGYNGHIFWDTEIWMYPPLLLLQPPIAESLLEYRYERLPAARHNAFMHGYEGAMFPWESADDGSEDTPVWALTGPFQHHISADIAWAAWQYFLVTKDEAWLRQRGWPLIQEVAAFWVSRVERNGPGQYDIKNVIGANEYEENIDNNAYTNGMVKTVLAYATEAALTLGLTPDSDWAHVADNIPLLRFPDGTTRENATYDGAIIKQADVNLLAFPLNIVSDEESIRRDLAYYEPRMAPEGPAMGISVLATLYAQLGDSEKAFSLFEQSYQPNEVPPFGVLAETAGGTNPYFATGAGGMLQAVLFGFGGLEVGPEGVTQNGGLLPPSWTSLTITGIGPDKQIFEVRR